MKPALSFFLDLGKCPWSTKTITMDAGTTKLLNITDGNPNSIKTSYLGKARRPKYRDF